MAKINPALLQRLMDKLGVKDKRIYKLIQDKANEAHVDSYVASLLVARDHGVGYQRYVRDGDLAEMRGAAKAPEPVRPSRDADVDYAPTRAKPKARQTQILKVKTTRNNSVFVVHGRDGALRESMFNLLMKFGLNPLEWSHAIAKAKGNNPNIEKTIHNAMKDAHGIIVLFSPDEDAKLKRKLCSDEKERKRLGTLEGQARPNVLFEAGLALGMYPKKTLLVQVGDTREISDLGGKHMLRLSNSAASRNELAQRLRKMGFKVSTTGQDWTTTGDFKR